MVPVAGLLAFAGGITTEALSVLWVHLAERNNRLLLLGVALVKGVANVCGIGGAVTGWECAGAYVLGYGLGPLVGIRIKQRFLLPTKKE